MKVTVEDISSVKKVMHIEVPAKTVRGELDKAYRELKKTAKIKGFRPGKTPRSVLERLYKKDVNADVSMRLIQASLVDALQDTQLKVVGKPDIDPPEIEADADYRFDAAVEVRPEIHPVDFKGLALKKTRYAASEAEIENQLKMLQRNLAQRNPIEEPRPVAEDDFVQIDYEGFKDGQPFEETPKTEKFIVKVGEARLIKAFDDELVGMQAGEDKSFEVTFPSDYFNANLAGLTIQYQVHLNEIREEVLPEIDDEFAAKVGAYETLEALRQAIHDNLEQGYAKRTEQELNEQIFQALIEQTEFELPESLVAFELESILNDAERSFANQDLTFEKIGLTREGMAEKYRDTAEKQVRRYLLLGKIIEQEGLELSDEALDSAFQEMAESFQQPADTIKAFYSQQPDKLEGFKHAQLEKQAIRLIIENGQIEEVEPEAPAASDDQDAQ